MHTDEIELALKTLIKIASHQLSDNYSHYYPKSNNGDPNERDITTALVQAIGIAKLQWRYFTEVPINHGKTGNTEKIIDLLLLPCLSDESDFAILVESKNAYELKQKNQVLEDFSKMKLFMGLPLKHPSGMRHPFPEKQIHIALIMDWKQNEDFKNQLAAQFPDDVNNIIVEPIRENMLDTDFPFQSLAAIVRWNGPWTKQLNKKELDIEALCQR